MRQTLYILIVLIFMPSCATILNQPHKYVTVHTTEPSTIIHRYDTVKTVNNKANLLVERKKEPLSIITTTDSIAKSIEIKSRNSFMYWLNIPCTYGIGMLVDMDNPNRHSYPNKIYINSADAINKYYRYSQAGNNGELHLHLSVPYINSFCLKPEKEGYKINTGFWGIKTGLDYYYLTNRFISLGVSGVTDFFLPVIGAIDMSGEYELMRSMYISLSNNYKIRRFTVGYGFSYGKNTWNFIYHDRFDPPPPTRDPVKKSHSALGLIFPTYFQAGEYFNIGIVYRPTFYRPNMPDKFLYEHLISIDLDWKIRLKK